MTEMVAAINPAGGVPQPGQATIFLAEDRNGFPGRTLESFSVRPDAATGLLLPRQQNQIGHRLIAKYSAPPRRRVQSANGAEGGCGRMAPSKA